jgi:hypothetical protein
MYFSLTELLTMIPEPTQALLWNIANKNHDRFFDARGSSHNHQAWDGGYMDHVREVMNIAVVLYNSLNPLRSLPFSLADALIVMFLHDIEKPWKHEFKLIKSERPGFRQKMLDQYGIVLTEDQARAFKYVEGENEDYTPDRRIMNELGAFCHMCDIASARLWHNRPGPRSIETWGWRWFDGPPTQHNS